MITSSPMTEKSDQGIKADSKIYEVGYLVGAAVPEEKIAEEVALVRSVLEKNGAKVLFEELPRIKQLAYVIEKSVGGKREKHQTAYFGFTRFEVSGDSLADIKKGLEAIKNIVRIILIMVPKEIPVVSKPLFKARVERPKVDLPKEKDKEAVTQRATMTEAELDKTIEELVVE